MRELISLFRELIGKRKLVTELAKADFRKRFVGSYFGIVWMFIQPMVTIAIYAFIFGEHGMKNAPPVPGATYVIWLTPGIIPWFYFSEILNTGTNCLQEYHYLVKKVVFQVEMLPVIKLISCFLVHACFLIIMAGLYLIDRAYAVCNLDSGVILFLCGVDAWTGAYLFYQRRAGIL